MKKALCLSLTGLSMIIATCFVPVFAGDTTNALPYLRMGLGSRALAMGGAFTSIADDASAAYWNPAGITAIDKIEIMTMYSSLSLDRTLNMLGAVIPTATGSFGLSLLNSGVGNIKGYDENKTSTGNFDYQSNTILISYGTKVQEQLSAGANVKIITDAMKDNSRTGFALDFGVLTSPVKNFSIGLKMQDILNKMGDDTIPMSINFGMSYKLFNGNLTLSGDINKIADRENLKTRAGVEYKVANILSFGAGVNDGNLSFGLSFYMEKISIAYAYVTDDFKVADRHHISLGYKF
jgi:hypothetical protein